MTPEPVRKSITVKSSAERAFRVFTEGIDTWWPRTHHIGKAEMLKTIIEGRTGGRCYSEHTDGSEANWGQVLVWDPPKRFVMAWQITATWQYEPDLSKSSEVEVQFTPQEGGTTRVDLEHRHLERYGDAAQMVRAMMDGPGAWNSILELFNAKAAED